MTFSAGDDRPFEPLEPFEPAAIATDRLLLRPLHVGYAEEMAGVLSDPRLYAFIGGSPPSPLALRARYERLAAGSPDPAVRWCNWLIELRDEACLVGTVQATITPAAGSAEIAWVVGTAWQGRGIATEAARGLAAWLVLRPVREVVAHIHPLHRASAAVAAAVGLAETGEWHEGEAKWRLSLRS